jgi:hypothetical protein
MKKLLKAVGMTLLCTILGMIGLTVFHFVSAFFFGRVNADWHSGPVVGVGDGFAIALETRCSSPVGFAEYDQRLRVYSSGKDGRTGKEIGTVELFPNTGGRTHSLVYAYRGDDGRQRVQIQERSVMDDVDLTVPAATNVKDGILGHVAPAKSRVFVGTFSGESYPLKFLPAAILSEADSLAKIQPPKQPGEQAAPSDGEKPSN